MEELSDALSKIKSVYKVRVASIHDFRLGDAWEERILDSDAILDRIVHDAHRLELTGESMRKKRKTEAETQEIQPLINNYF